MLILSLLRLFIVILLVAIILFIVPILFVGAIIWLGIIALSSKTAAALLVLAVGLTLTIIGIIILLR
ncbi:MAG: hypothetical protein QXR74_07255 [Candidatus Bathyarchaeia archaeon]